MSYEKVENTRKAMRWGLTCEKGQCQERVNKNGKEIIEVCKFKPTIKQVEENTQDSQSCHYYLQKYEALVSNHLLDQHLPKVKMIVKPQLDLLHAQK